VISEEEAVGRILEKVAPLAERMVPVSSALDCFSGRDLFAQLPLPAFDNSAMDGYAVVASSCRKGVRLRVIGEQPAGPERRLHLCAGEAVRIFTGAPIPADADAVIMQEEVTCEGAQIIVNTEVASGELVRRRGCDLAEGQKILAKGQRIRPATLALLASQGFAKVAVGGEAAAAILSTGDELAEPGEQTGPGQIYDSNPALLHALVQRCGGSVKSVERCRDERGALAEAMRRGSKNDVLIITGGVSVGEHDLVKDVWRQLGAEIAIWRVAIKPGKPFLFGRLGDCFVFGLPGNPVSAFVTFLQFVRPAILKMRGASSSELELPRVPAELRTDLHNGDDRPHYIRGRLADGKFTVVGRQESHALFGLSQSNALLRMAVGQSLKAGQIVDVQIWDW
jgi:molybdopterin molybdotransferase